MTHLPSGVKAGHARVLVASVAMSVRFENVWLGWLKSITASECPWPVSSWLKAMCWPSGEKAGVPSRLMTPSQPGAAIDAPVCVSNSPDGAIGAHAR